MSVRLWRKNGPMISVEGRKGYFDVAYGQDSPSQKLDVFLPGGQGPFPAIISIHGGGYVACDKRQKEMIEPMLAGLNRGFAVIGLNYRLAGESGFPEPVRDIKRAFHKGQCKGMGHLPGPAGRMGRKRRRIYDADGMSVCTGQVF